MAKRKSAARGQSRPDHPSRSRAGVLLRRLWYDHPIVRFISLSLLSILFFFLILRNATVQETLVVRYSAIIASCSRVALRLLGIAAGGSGPVVSSPEFSVTILNVCNGLEATAILMAAILAFPTTWRNKLIGLAIGYPALFLINLLRVVVLFILGFKRPDVFETVHYYYAQAFVIAATVCIWLVWITTCCSYAAKSRSDISR